MTRWSPGWHVVAALVVGGMSALQAMATAQAPIRPALPMGLDLYVPIPADNPLTAPKVALGRRLFFDPMLSRDRTVACASCHDPERAFANRRPISVGVFGRLGRRNVPTLVNRAYGRAFFWDGRTTSLEQQVLKPIEDPAEMGMTLPDLLARIRSEAGYHDLFERAFGRGPTADAVARALASYVRTILSGSAAFDRYTAGEPAALSPEATAGLILFRGKANCVACHPPPTFTDERFHNTGVAWHGDRYSDLGRAGVTGDARDRGRFKTPTLRDVAQTAPYMHDGSMRTLEEVIEFYARGGRPNPELDGLLGRLNLGSTEKRELVAFLRSLSGRIRHGV